MKKSSVIVKLVAVGVVGAAALIGCSDDNVSAPGTENTVDTVAPEESTTTTSEDPSTTVKETTTTVEETTTTIPRPTTTVKKTTAATAPTTQAPVTAPPTQAPTTAPPTTLPPVNVSYMWSSGSGCGGLGFIILDVDITGATSAGSVSVSVNGLTVSSYGGPTTFGVGDTSMIMFDQWPILSDGTYPVTITASSSTQGPTTATTSVTYNCPP